MWTRMHDGCGNRWHNPANVRSHLREEFMAPTMRAGIFMRRRVAPALAALAVLSVTPHAQAAWPERAITLIACFPAGGGTDIAARLIAPPLGEALKVPVIVENRGGAGGNIGISVAKRAKPDGYTFLVCSSAFVVNPSLYANPPYAPKDFTPVMVLGASPNALVTPAQSAFQTLGDLVAKAKAEPGKLNWTSPGAGTTPYLAGELLQQRTGIKMVHIPFQGAGPALTAALGGQVDMYTAALGSLQPMIDAGKLRALAVTSPKRWPDLPNLPTLDEQGVHDAVSDTFQGIFAPAGTPQPVIDRMVKEITAILARPDIRDRYAKSGLPVTAEPPDVFRARIARELPMYKEIVDKAGLKIK
jgi:tripartite-type tricarboxylate transporter receptor subunit TctC